eukprot:SAG31_NODE_1314_length_8851_cov_7.233318_5_plen_98_part_00
MTVSPNSVAMVSTSTMPTWFSEYAGDKTPVATIMHAIIPAPIALPMGRKTHFLRRGMEYKMINSMGVLAAGDERWRWAPRSREHYLIRQTAWREAKA